ncbi:UNVERIFIED_CONTAM: hypothetical protein Scaly_3050200 [Sesamum calycinum]|uniref:RNase H type-1 domain-containing protein n=1 Tax=Sesamum calycinum TaxID=2727403 RepID=A0AAW2K0G0_9LAMI
MISGIVPLFCYSKQRTHSLGLPLVKHPRLKKDGLVLHLTSDRKPDADSLSLAESLRKEEARCRREGRTVLKKGLESGALLEMRKEQGETRKPVTGASSIAVACRLTRSFWDIVFGRAMSLSMERLTKETRKWKDTPTLMGLPAYPTVRSGLGTAELKPGSRTEHGVGAGIVIESPSGLVTKFAFQLEGVCSNNRAEYEALIIILKEVDVLTIEIIGDSQLVINHIAVLFPVSPVDAYLASSV